MFVEQIHSYVESLQRAKNYKIPPDLQNVYNVVKNNPAYQLICLTPSNYFRYKGNNTYAVQPEAKTLFEEIKGFSLSIRRPPADLITLLEEASKILELGQEGYIALQVEQGVKKVEESNKPCLQAIGKAIWVLDQPCWNEGDFGFMVSDYEARMLKSHLECAKKFNLMPFFKNWNSEVSFMFSNTPELTILDEHTADWGHSGASFAYVCRELEKIAKLGWDCYVKTYLTAYSETLTQAFRDLQDYDVLEAIDAMEAHEARKAHEAFPVSKTDRGNPCEPTRA